MKIINITTNKIDVFLKNDFGGDVLVSLNPGHSTFSSNDIKTKSINLFLLRRFIDIDENEKLPLGYNYFNAYPTDFDFPPIQQEIKKEIKEDITKINLLDTEKIIFDDPIIESVEIPTKEIDNNIIEDDKISISTTEKEEKVYNTIVLSNNRVIVLDADDEDDYDDEIIKKEPKKRGRKKKEDNPEGDNKTKKKKGKVGRPKKRGRKKLKRPVGRPRKNK